MPYIAGLLFWIGLYRLFPPFYCTCLLDESSLDKTGFLESLAQNNVGHVFHDLLQLLAVRGMRIMRVDGAASIFAQTDEFPVHK